LSFLDEIRKKAEPAAMHEAGHYVIARVLRFPTENIYVVSDMLPNADLKTVEQVYDHLERRVQVICAGACAEFLKDGTIDEDRVFKALDSGGTASNDWAKVRENVHTMVSIRSDPNKDLATQLEEVAVTLLNKAADLVVAEDATISALAKHLVHSIKLPGKTELGKADVDALPAIKKRFI
jgi:hypothetical protein